MLSRGGGKTHGGGGVRRHPRFQKVVNTVADLPSTIDAEPGTRVIVRETEEVYGLDKLTRMWAVIGTLKKVGGKRPEELSEHVDARDNPHKTSFQDVIDVSSKLTLSREIHITRKKIDLRLLSGASALRIGPDAGESDGLLWINAGRINRTKTVLRVVNYDGVDQIIISGDGTISSAGSACFAGGFKGPAVFEDEITASEGIISAKGYDLVLAGDKGVLLKVEGIERALFTSTELSLNGNLIVGRNLRIGSKVQSNLNPEGSHTLGVPQARWKSAALGDLDITGGVIIHVPSNSKKAPIQISGTAPGHGVTFTPIGRLGLGTDSPEARLDVRGSLLVGDESSRLRISGSGISSAGWALNIVDGEGMYISAAGNRVLHVTPDGVELLGNSRISGSLTVTDTLKIGGIKGLNSQSVVFKSNGTVSYKAKSHQFIGALSFNAQAGEAPLTIKSAGDTILVVASDGALLGSKLGSEGKPWDSAYFDYSVVVGDTTFSSGKLIHTGEFTIDARSLIVGPELRIIGPDPMITTLGGLKITGSGSSIILKPGDKLAFSKPTKISGVSELAAGSVVTKDLKVQGSAEFCSGMVGFSKGSLNLKGDLTVSGLAFKHHTEKVDLRNGGRTKFEIPAGVRVEAVLVKLRSHVTGVRFLMVGDPTEPNRFSGPSTNLRDGALIRGMDHWGQSRMVQKVKAPVVVSGDGIATGIVDVTIYYVDPAAF